MTLKYWRGSVFALLASFVGWAAGCATPQPMVDPAFASGAYTPTRVAVMPPDVFVVLDQVGENDDVQSAALGQAVLNETVRLVEQTLRARGYDVDLSARWDGIVARDGSLLVSRDELGGLANGILQFGNGPAGGGEGPMSMAQYVAPELASKVGWATQSDALLYVNVKGVTTTSGKRAASVLGAVFIVVVIAAIVLALAASSKGGGGSGKSSGLGSGNGNGGWRGAPVARSSPSAGSSGGWHGSPSPTTGALRATPPGAAPAAGGWRGAPTGGVAAGGGGWRAGSAAPVRAAGAPVYYGGPHVGLGVGVWIPLDGPVYTHDGNVGHDDEFFAGDELYVSMTLVSTYDGRVLWHARQSLDLDADDNRDVDRMVQSFLGQLPMRASAPAPAAQK